jgi:outer membrane protein OmpA-like peptidoglycan-associated protein
MFRPHILPFLLLTLAGPPQTWGADPAKLKDTLDKVQSQAGSKAVEDLVGKLKGPAPRPAPQHPTEPAPGSAARETTATEAPAHATPTAPVPAANPEAVAGRAAPSIDLEVFFAYKSTAIGPEAASTLQPLGRALRDPRLAGDTFLIAGHTDAKGGSEYNLALSQQRAEAVRRHLIANFGIEGTRLIARGLGAQQLKRPDEPLSAANRRVQIVNLSNGGQR